MKTAEVTRITTINLAYGRGEASLELPSENLLGVYLPKVVEADPLSVQRIELTQGDKRVVYQKSFLKIWKTTLLSP